MKMQKKLNYVVWPAPSPNFLNMARGPKSLATPVLNAAILAFPRFCYLIPH